MMKRISLCLLTAALLTTILIGCNAFGGSNAPTLDGSYSMGRSIEGSNVSLSLNLSQTGNDLSGTGRLTIDDPNDGTVSITLMSEDDISGTHNHPDVEINMVVDASGKEVMFEGKVDEGGDRMEGTLVFLDSLSGGLRGIPSGTQRDVIIRSET